MKPLVLSFSASLLGEPVTFGQFIKKARLEEGLKQKDVAQAIGVDEMTMVNWERYKTIPRTTRKVRKLCEFLRIDFGQIAGMYSPQLCNDKRGAGSLLHDARRRQGLTREETAKAVGIDPTTLRRWESNAEWPPKWMYPKLRKLCRILEIEDGPE